MCLDKLRNPYTMSYMDDIIMFTNTLENKRDKNLNMHWQASLRIVSGKMHLFQDKSYQTKPIFKK